MSARNDRPRYVRRNRQHGEPIQTYARLAPDRRANHRPARKTRNNRGSRRRCNRLPQQSNQEQYALMDDVRIIDVLKEIKKLKADRENFMSLTSEKQLTPFQENELQWLRRQVDQLQDDKMRRNAVHKERVEQDLWVAREELNNFVVSLRKAGKNI